LKKKEIAKKLSKWFCDIFTGTITRAVRCGS
jgi:hypothetical protein